MCIPTSTAAIMTSSVPSQRKRCRRVSFNTEECAETTVASFACLGEQHRQELWYSNTQIDEFRTETRELCRTLRTDSHATSLENTRGLELRADLERQERKFMTIKCVIQAYAKYGNPRQVAFIYKKCSAWSTAAASAMAQEDFSSAYGLGLSYKVPTMDEYPLPFRPSKRSSTDGGRPQASRRVRRRTEAVL